ncbi:hypothetical protein CEXT_535821 [Caerostris extrusa]|uniref:Uncharacterized protein n=1 Tax=Caerostris extrusa TaxID=172846 RepID=A0AAV4W0B7_CAEEX|nr:hypothetical protein CEXT_535821 [Caerostris extrusa]
MHLDTCSSHPRLRRLNHSNPIVKMLVAVWDPLQGDEWTSLLFIQLRLQPIGRFESNRELSTSKLNKNPLLASGFQKLRSMQKRCVEKSRPQTAKAD